MATARGLVVNLFIVVPSSGSLEVIRGYGVTAW
jgi:hypothetical protein